MTATTVLVLLRRAARLIPPLLLAGTLAPRAGAQAVAPATAYVRENWTVADGLPINTITALVQTRDGYLWLGTNDGVVRFDGVRFTVYNAGNTPEIPSNRIVSLHEDGAGTLWILTEQQHLIRYARHRIRPGIGPIRALVAARRSGIGRTHVFRHRAGFGRRC